MVTSPAQPASAHGSRSSTPAAAGARPGGRRRRSRAYLWFLLIPFAAYALFFLYPMVKAFNLSRYNWSGFGNLGASIGFDNFGEILGNQYFYQALGHNFQMYVGIFILQNTVSLGLAVMLSRRSRWSYLYRGLLILPVVTSALSAGFIWKRMLAPDVGLLNPVLEQVGLGAWQQDWLGNPSIALITVTLIQFWQWNGIATVTYLAGLQGVPDTLKESARLDGATSWQVFRHVTFPSIAPAFTIVTVLSFILTFRSFDLIYVLGGPAGAPAGATAVLGTLVYSDAFGVSGGLAGTPRLSYGIAEGILMFLIVLVISGVALVVLTRREKKL